MNYEDLLKRAMEKLPKKAEKKSRFEVPSFEFEFSGNRTILKNFTAVADILRRDPRHLAKYLCKELATPGNIQSNTLVLQRKLPSNLLQEKLNAYIKLFVFCKVCGEPDTKIVKEDRISMIVCEACGAKYPLRSLE